MTGSDDKQKLGSLLADKAGVHLPQVVHMALADGAVLQELLIGVASKNEAVRYNCFKALLDIGASQPGVLYRHWDYFAGLLGSSNSYHRSVAVKVMADLVSADTENRFETVFDQYFDLLDDDQSVVTARYLAQSVGKIARAKPHLQATIAARLLQVDKTHHTQSRKDLIAGDIIQSLGEFFESSGSQEAILAFVERQLGCSSPSTRKAAKAFLKDKA